MATEEEMRSALAAALIDLWADFDHAVKFAAVRLNVADERHGWSIQMLNVADRIAEITRLVGSPSWKDIQVPLLLDGWWSAVHRRANLPVPAFDRKGAQSVLDRNREVASR